MAPADWQTALRRQFGPEQHFGLENLGTDPVFSEFRVHNPATDGRYRVVIRGTALGENTCTCPDFATNDLGTCKHVEFTLARLASRRGGKAALKRGYQPEGSEIWLDHAGQRRVRLRLGSACPLALRQAAECVFTGPGASLEAANFDQLEGLLAQAEQCGHALHCREEVWRLVAQARDARRRDSALTEAYPKGTKDKALKKLLAVPLYPYQLEGALFAARAGRALIGDEMGLGKTIQAVAAAELLARHAGVLRVLVVCPTSLKHQWQSEFARFSRRSAQVIQGLRPQRQQQYREDSFCKITHYETLARDADLIARWQPDLVIADEAQRIKNWNTVAARALKRIDSPYAVVLTGTPLENRLEELISIIQFVDQHRLGPTWRLLDEHQRRDEAGRVIGYQALDRIGQTLARVMLRRRKAEVLTQLPERVDQRRFVPLTPQQRVHHDENGGIVTRIVSRWRKTGYLSDTDQRRLQCALQAMRMACNSTWLLDHETDHGTKIDELFAVLDEILSDPQAKVVVFSQWLGTHELICRRLGPADGQRPWGHVLFNGTVPGEQRGALVERFHTDPDCRLFLSTDAGGVGLNLQHAAAAVVNMDLPWNPAVLEQRIGRVHRMGQRRGVQVINLVAQSSIEEGMLSVLAFKRSLADGVLDGGASEVFLQGTRLSRFMETVEEVAGAMGEGHAETEPEAMAADDPSRGPAVRPASSDEAEVPAHGSAHPTANPGSAAAEPAGAPPVDPWAGLIDAAIGVLRSWTTPAAGTAPSAGPRIEPDPVTGQPSVRLPLPDPAVLKGLVKALEPWLK